ALQDLFAWAKPGKRVVCFVKGREALTCVGNAWYRTHYPSDEDKLPYCNGSLGESASAYIGSTAKLRDAIVDLLAEKEVVITAEVPGKGFPSDRDDKPLPRDWLHGEKRQAHRVKVS